MTGKLSRRSLFGVAAAVLPLSSAEAVDIKGDMPWREGEAARPLPPDPRQTYLWFDAKEAAFIEAATARLIPKDDLGGGALEANVPAFIDRQLAGEYGHGTRWYMQGPWAEPLKTQGYQTRFTPAQLYRAAIHAIDAAVSREHAGVAFANLRPDDQDTLLQRLESGEAKLDGVESKTFFALLLQNTMEGFFCDPIHGGNKDMIGWRLIGFPGARYDQTAYVTQHGKPYPLPPVGLTGRPGWSGSSGPGGTHG